MVSKQVADFARISMKIEGRYDNQEFAHAGHDWNNVRRYWTPKQTKRMRKQRNKWRKRIFGGDR